MAVKNFKLEFEYANISYTATLSLDAEGALKLVHNTETVLPDKIYSDLGRLIEVLGNFNNLYGDMVRFEVTEVN